MGKKQERINSLLRHSAANFLREQADRSSLITVTDSKMSGDLSRCSLFISVFPPGREQTALSFCQRKLPLFYEYLKEKVRMRFLPKISFGIDRGEKSRRRIEELLKK